MHTSDCGNCCGQVQAGVRHLHIVIEPEEGFLPIARLQQPSTDTFKRANALPLSHLGGQQAGHLVAQLPHQHCTRVGVNFAEPEERGRDLLNPCAYSLTATSAIQHTVSEPKANQSMHV